MSLFIINYMLRRVITMRYLFFFNRSPWKLHTILYNYAWWYTYIVHDCMVYLRENHAWLIWLCVVVLPLLMYPWSAIKTNKLTKLFWCCTPLFKVQPVIFLNLLAFIPLLNTNLVQATRVIIRILLVLNIMHILRFTSQNHHEIAFITP